MVPDLPAMLQPGMGNLPPKDQYWAADTGRFARPERYTNENYLKWLSKRPYQQNCLFATVPDSVGDAEETLSLSFPMFEPIKSLGYKVAFVGQDGIEALEIPWNKFDVWFIGGTTKWKLSESSYLLAIEAKKRGKWLHMGRVNSLKRMKIANSWGCDSVDGTHLNFGPLEEAKARVNRWLEIVNGNKNDGLR